MNQKVCFCGEELVSFSPASASPCTSEPPLVGRPQLCRGDRCLLGKIWSRPQIEFVKRVACIYKRVDGGLWRGVGLTDSQHS